MLKSDFKLEFTLKQHTPIIHFQSDQKGATLRATELKPKLDRFITKKLKDINPSLYEKYREVIEDETIFPMSEKKGSNAYKISIVSDSMNTLSTPKAYVNKNKETDKTAYQAPYFADAHQSVMASTDITVTIRSFNSKLLELLDKCKDYIFIYENFGTRQSKGFGSYIRSDIDKDEIDTILSQHNNQIFKLGNYSDYKAAFMYIDTFYKELKMGINKPYKKSLLFKYMCKTYSIGWEKKFIKNTFPEVIHGDHSPVVCTEPDDKEFRYIRAVLGLAEHNEFRPSDGKKQIKIESVDRDEDDATKAKYQRFKSPLTFKVFNNTIYVLFDDTYKDILNKEFKFRLRHVGILQTPSKFDMYHFLKFVEKETNLEEIRV